MDESTIDEHKSRISTPKGDYTKPKVIPNLPQAMKNGPFKRTIKDSVEVYNNLEQTSILSYFGYYAENR